MVHVVPKTVEAHDIAGYSKSGERRVLFIVFFKDWTELRLACAWYMSESLTAAVFICQNGLYFPSALMQNQGIGRFC